MKRYPFFSILFLLWLAACSPAVETAVQPTSTSTALAAQTLAATETASATAEPKVTTTPLETAVATATLEPTTTVAEPEADPYVLAREILEQTSLPESEDWQITLCAGEAAVLCIGDGTENVGFAELNLYLLSNHDAEHPVRLAASQISTDPARYTAEDEVILNQALIDLAEEYLEVIRVDRAITFPDDTFTPLPSEQVQMGELPALAFGFVRSNEAGDLQERYLNVAAFDTQFIYWLGINYDPASLSTFASETAVSQFAPIFYDLATRLPIHQPTLTTLPGFIPVVSLHGDFPQVSWSLSAELPETATAVAVLGQPAQSKRLTAEQAAATAQKYGFADPLYVEYRTGFTLEELIDMGMFIAFDGSRNLALWSSPYFYNDATHNNVPGFDLPFAQAAPTAEKYLKDNGWLTFPYEMAESDQGEGVLFLPIVDGVLLTSPAYGVRVAADNGISTMFIYPQDNLGEVGRYPILTAEMAWEQVQTDPNQPGIFYQIDPPPLDTAVSFPPSFSRLPAVGETGTVYNNIWVYRPVSGEGPPIIVSNDYFRITGDPAMLEELSMETDYLVKLTGTVQADLPGLQSLALTDWELVPDAGGLPLFYGQIEHKDGQTFLVDADNRTTYLLPDAPADLPTEREAAVAGLPETVAGIQTLNWQEITTLPLASETILPRPTDPMQVVTVDSVKLIYLRMPAHVSGLEDNLYFPVWQFSGLADNGEQVIVWVTAVLPEYMGPSAP